MLSIIGEDTITGGTLQAGGYLNSSWCLIVSCDHTVVTTCKSSIFCDKVVTQVEKIVTPGLCHGSVTFCSLWLDNISSLEARPDLYTEQVSGSSAMWLSVKAVPWQLDRSRSISITGTNTGVFKLRDAPYKEKIILKWHCPKRWEGVRTGAGKIDQVDIYINIAVSTRQDNILQVMNRNRND